MHKTFVPEDLQVNTVISSSGELVAFTNRLLAALILLSDHKFATIITECQKLDGCGPDLDHEGLQNFPLVLPRRVHVDLIC